MEPSLVRIDSILPPPPPQGSLISCHFFGLFSVASLGLISGAVRLSSYCVLGESQCRARRLTLGTQPLCSVFQAGAEWSDSSLMETSDRGRREEREWMKEGERKGRMIKGGREVLKTGKKGKKIRSRFFPRKIDR